MLLNSKPHDHNRAQAKGSKWSSWIFRQETRGEKKMNGVVVILLLAYAASSSLAVNQTQEAVVKLNKYGYLADIHPSKEQFRASLEIYQSFFGLEITGVLDDNTLLSLSKPRCGCPDFVNDDGGQRRKRFDNTGHSWPSPFHVTWNFEDNFYTSDLPVADQERILTEAFAAWTDVSGLSTSRTSDPDSSAGPTDIWISFRTGGHGDGEPFDGAGGVLAHAFLPTGGSGLPGDIHFDDAEAYTDLTPQGINLFQVAVHEIGHSMGLGHSDVEGAIMFPTYNGYVPNFQLHSDDIAGIRNIYGQQAATTSTTPTTQTTSTTPTTQSTTTSGIISLNPVCLLQFEPINCGSENVVICSAFYHGLNSGDTCSRSSASSPSCTVNVRERMQLWCYETTNCVVYTNNDYFDNACEAFPLAYMEVTYTCGRPCEMTTTESTTAVISPLPPVSLASNKLVCKRNTGTIECDEGLINIVSAFWGRTEVSTECGDRTGDGCAEDVTNIVISECNLRASCPIKAKNSVLGKPPCKRIKPYLNVTYTCDASREGIIMLE